MNFEDILRRLSDKQIRDLISLAMKEKRRREKIRMSNASWTSNQGIQDVLEASIEAVKKKHG